MHKTLEADTLWLITLKKMVAKAVGNLANTVRHFASVTTEFSIHNYVLSLLQ